MSSITHRHAQEALLERSEARLAKAVTFRQALAQSAARTGNPFSNRSQNNGFYGEGGAFEPYLRLDIDDFESGRGCAP